MVELGQLERRQADFAARNVRIVATSLDQLKEAKETQELLPHLVVLSDASQSLAGAAGVLGPHRSPIDGGITSAPTTVLIDRHGKVKWVFRPVRYLERLSPDDLLSKVNEHFSK